MANTMTESTTGKNLQAREEMRATDRYLTPAVNIVETDEGLLITADVPGATKDSLEINMENSVLTITARITRQMQGTPVYQEFEMGTYYRQFAIPETLDHAGARADLRNGILTLRIPKSEAARPRKIEIQTG